MLSERGADGQAVRIPADASRDTQASVQDIKDALRTLEAKHAKTQEALEELEQGFIDSLVEEVNPNFTEINEETIFNADVTFVGGVRISNGFIRPDGTVDFSGSQGFIAGTVGDPGISGLGNNVDSGLRIGGSGDDKVDIVTAGSDRWSFDASGYLVPAAADTYDIGASSLAVRNIYIDDTLGDGQIDGFIERHGCAWHNDNGISNGLHYCSFNKSRYDVEVLELWGYKLGGTSATLNVYVDDGGGNLLSSAYVLSTNNSWVNLGTLQNTTIDSSTGGAGRWLGTISATSGTVTDVSLMCIVKRVQS